MKFQQKKLTLALAGILGTGGLVATLPAAAQDIRVEVTGSSIRRVEAEGALPVTVVTKEDIQRSGALTTQELLQQVSAISTLGATQLATGAGNSTYGQQSISMRGLGSQRTLVLVNGRRVATFAADDAVNVNSIPISAISRIEVLRDGASAVYGSDAVAGVVNFILDNNYKGIEGGITYGAPTASGGGEATNAYVVGGFGDLDKDKWNVNASFAYQKNETLYGRDREYAATATKLPYYTGGATGQGNIEGGYTVGTGSAAAGTWVEGTRQAGFGNSPGTGYGNPLAANGKCPDIRMVLNPTNTSKGTPYCYYDSAPDVGLLPELESYNASLNMTYRVNNDFEVFANGLWSEQTVTLAIQPSPVRRSFNLTDNLFQTKGIDPALLIFPSNPNYQIAADYLNANGFGSIVGQPLAITSRVFDFGPRTSEDTTTQWRAVAGARGKAWGQDWELAYTHNENEINGTVTAGYFSLTEYAKITQTSNDWNPWSLSQSAAFNAKLPAAAYTGSTLDAKTTMDVIDGKMTGDAWKLPAGTMQYAAGFQWTKGDLTLSPSAAQFTGDIAGLGGATPNLSQDRDVGAIYGELNIPIVKSLEATVAARYDDYSDFGGTFNWFATARWQPAKSVLLRAAYGTGFRAPTLTDLWYPQILGSSAQFNDPVTGQDDLQVNEITGGNPALQPELSKQWSVGVVWQPVKQFSAEVDWFQIKLTDIIATPATQEVVSGNASGNSAYAGAVIRAANGDIEQVTSVTTNTGSAKVEGFDVLLNYQDTFSWGTPGISLQGTYMSKFDQQSPGGVTSHKVGTLVDQDCNPVLDSDSGGVVPRWKHVLSFNYAYGPWAANLNQNYYRSYATSCDLNGDQHYTGNQQIWDLQFAYTGIKNLRLAVGVKNLFDEDPPIFIPVSNQFQAGYDISMYDPRGQYVYGTITYKFK